MAKSKETFNKREKEKQRQKQKQEKQERMEERKASAQKGKSLDEMMAYLDENGNLTSTPPDPAKRRQYAAEDIEIGVPQRREEETETGPRTGVINFFNTAKGFGFIKTVPTGESVFFHQSQLTQPVSEGDRVVFDVEMEAKGPVAVQVRKEG